MIDLHSLKIGDKAVVHLCDGDYIDTVQTITLDGRNASDVILEQSSGNYTRYVSLFSNGELYVFKISGDSLNAINSSDINAVLQTADIA